MKKFFRTLRFFTRVGVIFAPVLFFAFPAFAQQQGTFVSLTNGQGVSAGAPMLSNVFGSGSTGSLAQFFNDVFTTALSAGAILAVLRLGYAGWLYMGSADMWGSKQHAKEVIRDAVLGLLLLLGIYIILNQINPNILNLNVLTSIQSSSSSTAPNNQASTPTYQTSVSSQ